MRDGHDQCLGRGNDWRKGKHSALLVALSSVVAMLEKRIQDSSNTKRRFDNIWRIFANYIQGGLEGKDGGRGGVR